MPSASPAAVVPDSARGSRFNPTENVVRHCCVARPRFARDWRRQIRTQHDFETFALPLQTPPAALRPRPAGPGRRATGIRRGSRGQQHHRRNQPARQRRAGQGRCHPGQGDRHRPPPRGGFAEGAHADHRGRRRNPGDPAHLPGAGPAAGAAQRQRRLHPRAAVERRRARHRQQPGQRRPGRQRRDLPRQRLPGPPGHGRVRPAGHRAAGAAARPAGHPVRQEHHGRGAEHQHPRADLHSRAQRRGLRRPGRLLPGQGHRLRRAGRHPRRAPVGLPHPRRRLHQEHPRRQLPQRRRAPGRPRAIAVQAERGLRPALDRRLQRGGFEQRQHGGLRRRRPLLAARRAGRRFADARSGPHEGQHQRPPARQRAPGRQLGGGQLEPQRRLQADLHQRLPLLALHPGQRRAAERLGDQQHRGGSPRPAVLPGNPPGLAHRRLLRLRGGRLRLQPEPRQQDLHRLRPAGRPVPAGGEPRRPERHLLQGQRQDRDRQLRAVRPGHLAPHRQAWTSPPACAAPTRRRTPRSSASLRSAARRSAASARRSATTSSAPTTPATSASTASRPRPCSA